MIDDLYKFIKKIIVRLKQIYYSYLKSFLRLLGGHILVEIKTHLFYNFAF